MMNTRPARFLHAPRPLCRRVLRRITGLARSWRTAARAALPWLLAGLALAAGAARAELLEVRGGRADAARSPDVLLIGTFTRDETEAGGCGCSFFPAENARGNGPLLLRVNADGRATMRVDGDLVALRKTGENVVRRNKKQLSSGDKLLLTLRGNEVAASVNAALERSCRVADGCRQLSYRGIVGVSRGAQRASAPAWGVCSC